MLQPYFWGGSLLLFNVVSEADTSCEYKYEYGKHDTRQNLESLVPSTEVSSLNLKTCANSERLQVTSQEAALQQRSRALNAAAV